MLYLKDFFLCVDPTLRSFHHYHCKSMHSLPHQHIVQTWSGLVRFPLQYGQIGGKIADWVTFVSDFLR